MTLYLDLIFLINYFFDFIILLSTSYILKRNIKIRRIIIGALIGSLSNITLFIKLNNYNLLFFKIILSILMNYSTFNYKNINYFLNNLKYIYIISIILGGFLYLLDNNIKINYIFIMILVPIFIYIYVKSINKYQKEIIYYHKVRIKYKNKYYDLNGFLDTGNRLIDPYFKRPIILINKRIKIDKYLLVPIDTVNSHNLIKCFNIEELYIDNKLIKNKILVGISPIKFKMEGIECILNTSVIWIWKL